LRNNAGQASALRHEPSFALVHSSSTLPPFRMAEREGFPLAPIAVRGATHRPALRGSRALRILPSLPPS